MAKEYETKRGKKEDEGAEGGRRGERKWSGVDGVNNFL